METALNQHHVGECVLGDLQGTDHLMATGQQMARHEAPDLVGVLLLRGSAHSGGVEGMAVPAGRSILLGTPV